MVFEEHLSAAPILLGPFFGLIYGPLYFLYTRSLITDKVRSKSVFFHFIPALLGLAVLFLPGTMEIQWIQSIGLLVTAQFVYYLVRSLRSIHSYRNDLKNETSAFHDISLFWLEIMIYVQLAILLVTLIESFYGAPGVGDMLIFTIYLLVLILINCFYYLGLRQVRLFSGFSTQNSKRGTLSEYNITEAAFGKYREKLEAYTKTEKPYLEFDISLTDLSRRLDISPRNLSHVINKAYGMNFYDFINERRLETAKNLLLASGNPVKEVMYDSGFSNKGTFNSIFKKKTGLTPTQYRQKNKS